MRGILGVSVGLALMGLGCGAGAAPPPFQPMADTKLLMQAVVDPQADVIWDAVGTIITIDGVQEIRPQSVEEWTAIRNAGVMLAEAGNLLMMVPRAVDGGDWMKSAQAMVDTGMLAVRAADARNPEQLFDAGGIIYSACTNCHQKYWIDAPQRP